MHPPIIITAVHTARERATKSHEQALLTERDHKDVASPLTEQNSSAHWLVIMREVRRAEEAYWQCIIVLGFLGWVNVTIKLLYLVPFRGQ